MLIIVLACTNVATCYGLLVCACSSCEYSQSSLSLSPVHFAIAVCVSVVLALVEFIEYM